MNPFRIHTAQKKTDSHQKTASELLQEHGVDPSVRDQLLAIAQKAENEKQIEPNEPVEPLDDTPPNLHSQIMVIPDFLSKDICAEYVAYIQKQQEKDLSVFDAQATNKNGEISWEVDKQTRDTQTIDIEPIKSVVVDLMRHAVRDYINPFYDVQVKDSEMPQVLVYHPGGHYRPHVDGEALFDDGSSELQWKRNIERDISLVVYLNSDFEGGEIVFPKQAISIKPRTGMLIAFPSNHHFLHGVNPVVKGVRFAIVDWFSLQ